LLLLSLSVSACGALPGKKAPPKAEEAPVQKKADEPVKKVEPPVEKPLPPTPRKAEQELEWGIRNYEEGRYQNAAGNFQNALDVGAPVGVQLSAHKYLAFIYCISGEKLACRGEFKKLLSLNPKFELSPAEAGHPTWGPVFREVKTEVTGKKRQK
jgi:hypothetical protein